VGTHNQPFDRLVRAADELASRLEETVIIQCGAATYRPQFAQFIDFVDEAQMGRWLSGCRVVVAHSGIGSILDALQAGKPLVLAPRMVRFDEHVDDHQFELAEAMAGQGRAVMVTDLSAGALAEAIIQAMRLDRRGSSETGLYAALREWLAEQAVQPPSRWRQRFRLKRGGK
jgi:UDP-N-acetylglucosamine transferase subunit ALG13